MSEENKSIGGLKQFIKESAASLVLAFLVGFLTWDVFSHLLADGMLPGQGAQGDVAGFLSPFFVVISASVLAGAITEESKTWQTAVFHLLFGLDTILVHFLLTFLVCSLSHTLDRYYDIGDVIFLVLVLFFPFAGCYALFRMISVSLEGESGKYMGIVIGFFIIFYFPIFMLVQAAGM